MSDQYSKPKKDRPTAYGEEFDSKLELEFAGHLEDRKIRGGVAEWFYHPLKFRIARNATYEPDFMTLSKPGGGWRGVKIYEVKGSWDAKNARDSRTRLQVAAFMYQWCDWYAVTRNRNGEWEVETIHATEALPME